MADLEQLLAAGLLQAGALDLQHPGACARAGQLTREQGCRLIMTATLGIVAVAIRAIGKHEGTPGGGAQPLHISHRASDLDLELSFVTENGSRLFREQLMPAPSLFQRHLDLESRIGAPIERIADSSTEATPAADEKGRHVTPPKG